MDGSAVLVDCPVCGHHRCAPTGDLRFYDRNLLAPYLAYNGFFGADRRYYTAELLDGGRADLTVGIPVHLPEEAIRHWYPATFAEKVDRILLYLGQKSPYVGARVHMTEEQVESWLFVNVWISVPEPQILRHRLEEEILVQIRFLVDFLREQGYAEISGGVEDVPSTWTYILLPKGYARIEKLQRSGSGRKTAVIAMKFGEDTAVRRERIRQGIADAGYVPILIDEIAYNGLITPELLKQIRDSRFVVADLTDGNNGAYFEDGYAMGLGRPVIQLCRKGVPMHFDIAQINTILWEREDEIPLKLKNRILATID